MIIGAVFHHTAVSVRVSVLRFIVLLAYLKSVTLVRMHTVRQVIVFLWACVAEKKSAFEWMLYKFSPYVFSLLTDQSSVLVCVADPVCSELLHPPGRLALQGLLFYWPLPLWRSSLHLCSSAPLPQSPLTSASQAPFLCFWR